MRVFQLDFAILWLILLRALTRIGGTSLALDLLLFIEGLLLYLIERFSELQILLSCGLYDFEGKSGSAFDGIVLQRPVVNDY